MVELLSYLFYFVSSTASTLQRRHIATRRSTDIGQLDFAFRVMFITLIGSSILVIFKKPELNQSLSVATLLAITCGFFGAAAIGSQYIAQRHVEAGVTTLVGNLYTPVAIVLASLLLNEGLKPRQILGTVILLSAVVMVSNKHRLSRWRFDRYFWLNVVSGVTLAVALTAERSLIKENGITTGTWLSWSATTIFLGLAALLAGAKSQYNLRDTSITGSLRFLQQLSWVILIVVVANLSLTSAVTTFKIVTVFVTAAIFLHEREDLRRKIIGSFIAVAGLLLMI